MLILRPLFWHNHVWPGVKLSSGWSQCVLDSPAYFNWQSQASISLIAPIFWKWIHLLPLLLIHKYLYCYKSIKDHWLVLTCKFCYLLCDWSDMKCIVLIVVGCWFRLIREQLLQTVDDREWVSGDGAQHVMNLRVGTEPVNLLTLGSTVWQHCFKPLGCSEVCVVYLAAVYHYRNGRLSLDNIKLMMLKLFSVS